MKEKLSSNKGFSLVELVIVVVILGIIAAIAIPRISSGSKNAGESALRANLQTLRNAIDWFYGEHHTTFPGVKDAKGGYGGAGSPEAFVNQLRYYTDADGEVSEDVDPAYPFGPYVRGSIPALPVGSNAGKDTVVVVDDPAPLTGADAVVGSGWIFNEATGEIMPSLPDTELGNDGNPLNTY